jgi:hypothetical protein
MPENLLRCSEIKLTISLISLPILLIAAATEEGAVPSVEEREVIAALIVKFNLRSEVSNGWIVDN